MTVNPGVVAIDATMKLVNSYLANNQVPFDKFPTFIKTVNEAVLDAIKQNLSITTEVPVADIASKVSASSIEANKNVDTAQAAAPEEGRSSDVETNTVETIDQGPIITAPVKPDTDMTVQEAEAVLAEPRGRGRPNREVAARRELAEAVIAYNNYINGEQKTFKKASKPIVAAPAPVAEAVAAEGEQPKRKRGRPSKAEIAAREAAENGGAVVETAPVADAVAAKVEEPKRKRGRPSKADIAAREAAEVQAQLEIDAPTVPETVLLKKGTVNITRDEEQPVQKVEEEKPARTRRMTTQEILDYTTQGGLSEDPDAPNYRFKILSREPVVPIKGSYTDDHVTCLLDGKKGKVLTRHLSSRYNMTEKQYRKHFNLPDDFPVVAPSYIRERSSMAKQRNFGKRRDDGFFKKTEEAKVIKRTRGTNETDVAA